MFGSFVLFKSNIIIIDDLMIIFGSNIESNQSYAYLKIDFIKTKIFNCLVQIQTINSVKILNELVL